MDVARVEQGMPLVHQVGDGPRTERVVTWLSRPWVRVAQARDGRAIEGGFAKQVLLSVLSTRCWQAWTRPAQDGATP